MKKTVYNVYQGRDVHWMDYRNNQDHACVWFVTWIVLDYINESNAKEWFEQAKNCTSCNAWLNKDLSNFNKEQYDEWEKYARERD